MRLKFRMSGLFFNDERVISALTAASRQNLMKYGSYVRNAARRSMRKVGKRGKPSAPGTPPKVRRGQLKRFLFFVWDTFSRSVVVGPQSFFPGKIEQIPGVHEHGGTLTRRSRKKKRSYVARYPARPFMLPAHQKEISRLPGLWRDSIKGS